MNIMEFRDNLRKLHPDFEVIKGKETNKTAAVLFRGVYQFAIPADGIYENKNDEYGVLIQRPTGEIFVRHRTIPEALAMAKNVLKQMREGGEQYRAMMGLGEFSDSNLK